MTCYLCGGEINGNGRVEVLTDQGAVGYPICETCGENILLKTQEDQLKASLNAMLELINAWDLPESEAWSDEDQKQYLYALSLIK